MGSKLPSDLLGFTCVRYERRYPSEMRAINQKLRKAIENEGRSHASRASWWQFSLTARGPHEPSAVSLIQHLARPRRRAGARGRAWQEDGSLSARYWSEAVKERKEPSGVFYYWKGERPRDPNAPQLDGTGKSCWSPPIARPGTSRLGRRRRRARMRGPPVFTGTPIQRTAPPSWMEATNGDARS